MYAKAHKPIKCNLFDAEMTLACIPPSINTGLLFTHQQIIVGNTAYFAILQWYEAVRQGDIPDSKVHGANMGPIWGRQDPGGPHVVPMNIAIWDIIIILFHKKDCVSF